MHELSRSLAIAAAPVAAAALALSGCTESPYADHPQIPRCFSKAQSVAQKSGFSALSMSVSHGHAKGDPTKSEVNNDLAKDRLADGIIEITNGDVAGSGFITTDESGEQFAVTAAHVVRKSKLSKLKITDDKGDVTSVTGGCYVYDNHGQELDFDHKPVPADHDLAILRLKQPLNVKPLTLSRHHASRGSWAYFANYQREYGPGNPAFYAGLIAATAKNARGMTALTGLKEVKAPTTADVFNATHVEPRASGGAVVSAISMEVIGITTAATTDGSYQTQNSLQSKYNLTFPGARFGIDSGGFTPTEAMITPSPTILRAIGALEHLSQDN